MIKHIHNDGGRKEAGFTGTTGDCVTRAIAIAFQIPYQQVYDLLNESAKTERTGKRKRKVSNARTGVYKSTSKKVILKLGGVWTPTMGIGSGCKVHLNAGELPATGMHILQVSKHVCAWINGELHDTYDCSRDGTRCVYGYFTVPDRK